MLRPQFCPGCTYIHYTYIFIYRYILSGPPNFVGKEHGSVLVPRFGTKALTIWYFVRPEQYSASLKPDSQVGKIGGIHQGLWEPGLEWESRRVCFSEFFCLGKKGERRFFGEKLREKF